MVVQQGHTGTDKSPLNELTFALLFWKCRLSIQIVKHAQMKPNYKVIARWNIFRRYNGYVFRVFSVRSMHWKSNGKCLNKTKIDDFWRFCFTYVPWWHLHALRVCLNWFEFIVKQSFPIICTHTICNMCFLVIISSIYVSVFDNSKWIESFEIYVIKYTIYTTSKDICHYFQTPRIVQACIQCL